MSAKKLQEVDVGLAREIELAEQRWAHEVIEELEEELALEEHFQECIRPAAPARKEAKELVLV